MTFLFWNLYKKDLRQNLRRLAVRHEVDVFVFAECDSVAAVLQGLNPENQVADYSYAEGNTAHRIQIFTRFPEAFFRTVREESRYTVRKISLPGKPEILLAAAHLLSLTHVGKFDQTFGAQQFAQMIRDGEAEAGHNRTIVVGDLNMNPFDDGVVAANALHGVMTKQLVNRGQRKVQGQTTPMFYNPMWNRFGDHPTRPPGTYYYDKTGLACHFWNVYDQVLIRPSLLPYWNDDDLHILTDDGEVSFVTHAGKPDAKNVSDHLPLLFQLDY